MHARTAISSTSSKSPPKINNNKEDDSAAKDKEKKLNMKLLLIRTGFYKHLGVVGMLLVLVWVWQTWKQQHQRQEIVFRSTFNNTTNSNNITKQQQQRDHHNHTTKISSSNNINNANVIIIPDCVSSPWKPHENLVGTCPGGLITYKSNKTQQQQPLTTAVECSKACCSNPACVSWQYRSDVGCLIGPDMRLGMEKDGPAGYCSDHPPLRWQGQFLVTRQSGKIHVNQREQACSITTWNPDEQPGQCFGLGDVRTLQPPNNNSRNGAQQCMEACCAEQNLDKCGAWQYHEELGCFYGKRMYSCRKADDPRVFEPFVGRRKFQTKRTYVDKHGQPFVQALKHQS